MSYRCINGFGYADRVYPGGCMVADDDPILKTHSANFAPVETLPAFTETATAGPGERREVAPTPPPERPREAPAPTKGLTTSDVPHKPGRPTKRVAASPAGSPTSQEKKTDA